MAPFAESDAGVSYTGGDLTDAAEYAAAEERERQATAAREAASRIGTGEKKPTPGASMLSPGGAQLRVDAMVAAAVKDRTHPLMDLSHPAHAETLRQFEEWNRIAAGDRAHTDLEIHGGERAFARELGAVLEGTYAESPERGIIADRSEQDAFMTLGRDLGVSDLADDVRHGMLRILEHPVPSELERAKQYEAQWTPAERQRINEQLEELHEVTDRWLAKHGISAQRREQWIAQLVLVEDRGKVGIDWLLNDLWATLWQRDPGGFSDVYAEWAGGQHEAAQARAAKAQREPEDDPAREVGRFGRP